MIQLIIFVTLTALIDGITTTQQVVLFGLLLSTEKPAGNSGWFIIGISSLYFICGLAGYIFINTLNDFIGRFFKYYGIPDRVYYFAGAVAGIIIIAALPVWIIIGKSRKAKPRSHPLFDKIKRFNPSISFLLGAFISVSGFPTAVLYIGTIVKLFSANTPLPAAVVFIAYYNILYALPMALPFAIFLIFRDRFEGMGKMLHIHVIKWNSVLTFIILSVSGLLLLVNSIAFFETGKPIISSRLF